MSKAFLLEVKKGQEIGVLNPKLTKLAILGQVYLENFDDVACDKSVLNKNVKRTANLFGQEVLKIQRRIYNDYYSENADVFQYIEGCTNRLIDLLIQLSMDQIINVMGFLEIYKHDKQACLDFLLENTERINNIK